MVKAEKSMYVPGAGGVKLYVTLQLSPAASDVPWQFWLALKAGFGGAPPNMLMGPNESAPLLVSVTAFSDVPLATLPKLTWSVEISSWVSTPPVEPVGIETGTGVAVGDGVGASVGMDVGGSVGTLVGETGLGVWQRGRLSPC
jgi:hypothetical protein